MKITLLATAVVLISISATLAAPTQTKANSDLKHQLLKLVTNRALIQQEDPRSDKDKEMAATFCKLAVRLLKYLGDESLNLGDVSEREYCQPQDIELPPFPGPAKNLADVYQVMFNNILKDYGIDVMLEEYLNFVLNRIG